MSILSDYVHTVEWMEAPMLGADLEDLRTDRGPAPRPTLTPRPAAIPPCGIHENHTQDTAGRWSAGAWLCALAIVEGQRQDSIKKVLRTSPAFEKLRTLGSIAGNAKIMPFLAREVRGRTVYRRIVQGERFDDLAREMGVLS